MQTLIQLIAYLDEHSGSLTFLATAVYVIATIFICYANLRSAKATREQVAESKRQFKETKRLEMLPYLQFESIESLDNQPAAKPLSLSLESKRMGQLVKGSCFYVKNIGCGTARDVTCIWHPLKGDAVQLDFPIRALQSGGQEVLKTYFISPTQKTENTVASLEISFKDLLGYQYIQSIEFKFKYTLRDTWDYKNCITNPPKIVEQETIFLTANGITPPSPAPASPWS